MFGSADFKYATFEWDWGDILGFSKTTFNGDAFFIYAYFKGPAHFVDTDFNGEAFFAGTTFAGEIASFHRTRFSRRTRGFGPLVSAGDVFLGDASFEGPVELAVSAPKIICLRTRWDSVTMRLRYASLDLTGATISASSTVLGHSSEFEMDEPISEQVLTERHPDLVAAPKISSLVGVDTANLSLTGVDLSRCRFHGAYHLDQLRIEDCKFAETPDTLSWTRRKVLAEEHYWRAGEAHRNQSPPRGWMSPPDAQTDPVVTVQETTKPAVLAATYRQLRKSFEDAKNEPDAADFYYGEMEMRRHDDGRPWAERTLLSIYWALSGYGLRASRALLWLLFSMALTVVLLMWVGLPAAPHGPRTQGTVTAGHKIDVTTESPDPGGRTPGPQRDRFSVERAKSAGLTTINSVIFRSAGQDLTLPGTYIEMTSRVVEPVLLALVLLAIRGRVKR
ncbi:pentapeptide repeat-containing protein [Streptomyces sp. NPDC056683]|uniref:pentapeptide repeat-containing protein n=1 Tax=Streptomyces sp. NPDC056683 TaxID=3345910 RepID=UPI0036856013